MNITIIGGGNIGTQFAVHCAAKGHIVKILTTKPEKFSKKLAIVDKFKNIILQSEIAEATSNVENAIKNANLLFVTVPAFMVDNVVKDIKDFVKKGTYICMVPGTGGAECVFKQLISKGIIFFGLQRVPSVARLCEYGKVVVADGYRDKLYISSIPNIYKEDCRKIISDLFDMRCDTLDNYLNITLTPSNPILHTTRLYSLFKDYHVGYVYDNIPLFYEEWNNESSEILLKCDYELQQICRKIENIKNIDLSSVRSLTYHYDSYTPEEMTNKIRSINSLKGLKTPFLKLGDGYVPDFNSRYFIADFPYGLAIIKQLAKLANVNVPNIDLVLNWFNSLNLNVKYFEYSDFGIINLDNLIEFYVNS